MEIREMVSFELGKEIKKVLSRAWDKEKFLSPHEKSNLLFVPRSRKDEKTSVFKMKCIKPHVSDLSFYNIASVYVFSMLFAIHYLRC